MTALQYAAGIARLAGLILPLAFAAPRLRRRLTVLDGPTGLLADLVLGLSLALVVAEALGAASALRAAPLIAAAVAVALGVGLADRLAPPARRRPDPSGRAPAPGDARPRPPAIGRDPLTLAAVVAVGIVVAQWAVQTARSLGAGMSTFDTLWYHMPLAAGFAQTATTTGLQYTQTDPLVATFPENSELVHALGIVALRSDLLSPLLNLAWLGIALLAGWCLGRPWSRGPATLLAVALVAATPALAITQPGQASNDIVGLAMFLAAAALLLAGARHTGETAVAGLAAGFALGTKVTMLVPGLALLALAVACVPGGGRRRRAAASAAAVAVTGGFWYLRNLIEIANPFGVLRLHLGPIDLAAPDSPLERVFHYSLITHLDETRLWGSRLIPGLGDALGPLWWAIVVAAVAGAAGALLPGRGRLARLLGLTALAAAVGYAALPTSGSFLPSTSRTFAQNLRYAAPALAFGLALCAGAAGGRRSRRGDAGIVGTLAAAIVVTQFAHGLWPSQPGRHAVAVALVLGAAAALAALGPWTRTRSRPVRGGMLGLALAAAAGGGFAIERDYQAHRYRSYPSDPGLARIYRWAASVHRARIAVAGTPLSYPLYGPDLANRVVYVGHRGPHHDFSPIATCGEWRAALAAGRFDYVVVTPPLAVLAADGSPEVRWTRDDPAATVALDAGGGDFVLRLTGRLHRCAATEPARRA